MKSCAPCLSLDCDFPTDLELYSLQGLQFFLNGQLYPVIFCPAGFDCNPAINGNIYFKCCNQTLSRPVNSGMSYLQIQALVQSMYNECLGRNCGDMPRWPVPPVFYFNKLQVVSGSCMSTGGQISIFVSTAPAGMFVGATQDQANAIALAYAWSNYREPSCIHSPKMDANPGWCCVGADLDADPAANTYTVTGPNSGGEYTFNVLGSLPPGTTIDKATHNTAILGGVPTTPGFYSFTVRATSVSNPAVYTEVADTFAVFGITNPALPDGVVGGSYSYQLLTDGGTPPVTFAISAGALPTGLTLHTNGLIDGTCTALGTFNFTVQFTDASGGTCTKALTIDTHPCFSSSDTLPDADTTPGNPYSFQLVSEKPAVTVLVFTITAGSLPPGLSLNTATGLISGQATTSGVYPFTVSLTGVANPCSKQYTITATITIDIRVGGNECTWGGFGGFVMASVSTGAVPQQIPAPNCFTIYWTTFASQKVVVGAAFTAQVFCDFAPPPKPPHGDMNASGCEIVGAGAHTVTINGIPGALLQLVESPDLDWGQIRTFTIVIT